MFLIIPVSRSGEGSQSGWSYWHCAPQIFERLNILNLICILTFGKKVCMHLNFIFCLFDSSWNSWKSWKSITQGIKNSLNFITVYLSCNLISQHAIYKMKSISNINSIFPQTLKWRDELKIEQYVHFRPVSKMVEDDLFFKYQGRDNAGRPGSFIDLDLTLKRNTHIIILTV